MDVIIFIPCFICCESNIIDKREDGLGKKREDNAVFDSFKSHESALRKYVSRFLLPSHEIDDICQETFLRSFESNIQNKIQQPKSFMYRVAKNLIMSQYRLSSYKLTDYIDDIPEDLATIETINIENDLESQRKLGIFCESIATLPEKSRKILIMRKVYGFSIKEISKRLNIPTSTINHNIAKGMICCDNAMEKYEAGNQVLKKARMSKKSLHTQSQQIGGES